MHCCQSTVAGSFRRLLQQSEAPVPGRWTPRGKKALPETTSSQQQPYLSTHLLAGLSADCRPFLMRGMSFGCFCVASLSSTLVLNSLSGVFSLHGNETGH